MALPLLALIPLVNKVIEGVTKFIPDKDLAAKVKADALTHVTSIVHVETMALIEGQVKIILAEAQGGWLQRNWRPMLMAIIGVIIANNYIVYPYINLFFNTGVELELPDALWALMKIGLGGYVLGRTGEKIVTTLKNGGSK